MRVDHAALDPRPKLALATAVTLVAVIVPDILPLGLLAVVVVVVVGAGGGRTFRRWLGSLRPFRILVPIILALNAVFYGGGRVLWAVPGVPWLSVSTGGIQTAVIIATRLLVIAGIAAWFAATTEPEDFEVALVSLGVPWTFGFLLSLTLRLVPELRDRFREIEDAQRSRGLVVAGSPIARVRARVPMLVPFLAATIEYGYELTEALAARDYGVHRHRTSIVTLSHRPMDYAVYAVSIAVLAGFTLTFLA